MIESELQPLKIKGKIIRVPIVQGGMGVGVSLNPLAQSVAVEGGVGIVSSAGLDRLLSKRNGKKYTSYDAAYEEVSLAKSKRGFAGINIMVALQRDYEASVKGALDAGADVIISGAGLPFNLPKIQNPKDTALIPIISSARALDLLIKRYWDKIGYRPDAVVLEGPKAGGHLGWNYKQLNEAGDNFLEKYDLFNELLGPVLDVANKYKNDYGPIPVIVAGGIYTHEDIKLALSMGAAGVQMGTRFLATEESSATDEYKAAVVRAKKEDIVIAHPDKLPPGSPCKFPFRIIRSSPMFLNSINRKPKCDKGYVLLKDDKGDYTQCPAKDDNEKYFCLCNGLLSSANYNPDKEEPLYTVGTNADLVDKIVPVTELMAELTGKSVLDPNP